MTLSLSLMELFRVHFLDGWMDWITIACLAIRVSEWRHITRASGVRGGRGSALYLLCLSCTFSHILHFSIFSVFTDFCSYFLSLSLFSLEGNYSKYYIFLLFCLFFIIVIDKFALSLSIHSFFFYLFLFISNNNYNVLNCLFPSDSSVKLSSPSLFCVRRCSAGFQPPIRPLFISAS